MTEKIKWIDGSPIGELLDLDFPDNHGPLICQDEDGHYFTVGNCNYSGGVCNCCKFTVGDCNYNGGVCDGCRFFEARNVKRFAYLIDDEELLEKLK